MLGSNAPLTHRDLDIYSFNMERAHLRITFSPMLPKYVPPELSSPRLEDSTVHLREDRFNTFHAKFNVSLTNEEAELLDTKTDAIQPVYKTKLKSKIMAKHIQQQLGEFTEIKQEYIRKGVSKRNLGKELSGIRDLIGQLMGEALNNQKELEKLRETVVDSPEQIREFQEKSMLLEQILDIRGNISAITEQMTNKLIITPIESEEGSGSIRTQDPSGSSQKCVTCRPIWL